MEVKPWCIVMLVRFEHSENDDVPMEITLSGMEMLVTVLFPSKARWIYLTVEGISTWVSLPLYLSKIPSPAMRKGTAGSLSHGDLPNAKLPMKETVSGTTTWVRAKFQENAESSMDWTVSGIVTCVIARQLKNAF